MLDENAFTPVSFFSLCHSTHKYDAGLIMPDGATEATFRGHPKRGFSGTDGVLEALPLVWFSPWINAGRRDDVKHHLMQVMQFRRCDEEVKCKAQAECAQTPLEKAAAAEQRSCTEFDEVSAALAASPAFADESRYGSRGIKIGVNLLQEALANHWGLHSATDIEFRVLGTFTYHKEWMHTILLCPKEDTSVIHAAESDAALA